MAAPDGYDGQLCGCLPDDKNVYIRAIIGGIDSTVWKYT